MESICVSGGERVRFSPDTPLSKSLWHFLEMTAYFYSSLPILPQHSVHGKGDIL